MHKGVAPYNASAVGDTRRSPYMYQCKFCGKKGLAWGVHGAHRRLFESLTQVHSCDARITPKKVSHNEGFADIQIPVENY